MNAPTPHLNDEQMSLALEGAADATIAAHLAACPACRAEADGLAGSLGALRMELGTLTGELYGDRTAPLPPLPRAAAPRRPLLLPLASCAALLAAVGLALGTHPMQPVRPTPAAHAPAQAPADELSDAALLEQVDRDLSMPVAPSLAPLTGVAAAGQTRFR